MNRIPSQEPGRVPLASFQLTPDVIDRWLMRAYFGLLLTGIACVVYTYGLDDDYVYGFVPTFSLYAEANVPTWFTSAVMACCAVMLGFIYKATLAGPQESRAWAILGGAFLYMSVDESAVLHEMLNEPVGALIPDEGLLFYGWVFPAAVVAGLVGWISLDILRKVPRVTRDAFLLAGAMYLTGALLSEPFIGWWEDAIGHQSLVFHLGAYAQEAMEMGGVVLFLSALIRYVSAGRSVALQLAAPVDELPQREAA